MHRHSNIYFLILTPILFGLSLLTYLFGGYLNIGDDITGELLPAAVLWGVALAWNFTLMYQSGSFKNSFWKRPVFMVIAFLLLALAFNFREWKAREIIISVCSAIVTVSYVVHFIKKRNKILLDLSKVLFVILIGIWCLFASFQLPYIAFIFWITFAAQLTMIIVFYRKLYKQKQTLRQV